MKNIKASDLLYLFLCGVILWYLYESIVFSKEIIDGVSQCIIRIINVVFPSLFGFMAVCQILVKSGLLNVLSKLFKPVSKYIFRLPEKLFSVYLLSCIGGYPVGVNMLSELVKDNVISKDTASRVSPFFYCISPSFAVGLVGFGIFNNVKTGIIVYLSCLITNTTALFIYSHIYKFRCNNTKAEIKFNSQILVDSVTSSGKSMLVISAMIIFFSYFIILLDCLKFYDIIKLQNMPAILKSLIEITYLSELSADLRFLPVISGIVSSGGLCILLQSVCIVNNAFSLKRLFLMRLPLSLVSYLVCFLIIRYICVDIEVLSYAISHKKSTELNILSLICLFFMIILIFFRKKNCNLQKSML
ncbi:MAG: hypothetical protein E7509_06675 [Ruminococcus sp.]|nr:hypothetical protein [Ruminococcus sp.]